MLHSMMLASAAVSYGSSPPAPPPAISRNSSNIVSVVATGTTFDVPVTLAEGTNRLLVAAANGQISGSFNASGTFDFGGPNAATLPTPGGSIQNPNTRIVTRMYYYYIPDAVSAGVKQIRFVMTQSNLGMIGAISIYNNVGGTEPVDYQTAADDFDPATISVPAVNVPLNGSLVVSALGLDLTHLNINPTGIATLLSAAEPGANGIGLMFGDNLNAAAGSLVTSWTRIPSSGTADGNILTATFPRLGT